MTRAIKGILVECDPSIRALISNIDAQHHDIVIQELDDTHLVIDASKVDYVKQTLNKLLSENTYNALEEEELNNA